MLNIGNVDGMSEAMKKMLAEFRRVQVSRFPIDVVCTGLALHFIDSRFPTNKFNYRNVSASLREERDEKHNITYTITSRLITNEKFRRDKVEHHSRTTNDPKKMFKFMRDYIKPLSALEIAKRSMDEVREQFSTWKQDMRYKVQNDINVSTTDLLEEVRRLRDIGVKPQTARFEKLYSQDLDAYEHYKKQVKHKKFRQAHVYVQPDESVQVTMVDDDAKASTEVYESLSECPEWLQQGITMLRMLDDKQRNKGIVGLGTKWGDSDFWVDAPEQ